MEGGQSAYDYHTVMMNHYQYQQLLDRLIRIETRQVKIMEALNIDPYTGMPQRKERYESRRDTGGRDSLQGYDDPTLDSYGKRPNY
jgi:hypothetical protein